MGCKLQVRSLFNVRGLQLECARVLHETLLIPVLMYGSETIIWKGKQRLRIEAVQTSDLRGLLDIRRVDKLLNVGIREMYGMTKRIDVGVSNGSAMWRKLRVTGLLRGCM